MLTSVSIAQTSPTCRSSNAASARSSTASGIMCIAVATCPTFKSSTDFPTRSSPPGKARSQPLWPKTSNWRVKNAHELTSTQLPETRQALLLRLEPTESLSQILALFMRNMSFQDLLFLRLSPIYALQLKESKNPLLSIFKPFQRS